MNLFSKINKVTKRLSKNFRSDLNFSLYFALLRILEETGRITKAHSLSQKIKSKREKYIYNYLHNNLETQINELKLQTYCGEISRNSPIWICWWTGEDQAPDLVKQCIKSIRTHSNGREVILINKENYNRYVEIPTYMLEKSQNGDMCFAHLCDYIRISLLYKYGGLWLDSTIFCTSLIPEEYFIYPFFTCKSEYDESCSYISKLRWTTFVLGSHKENSMFLFMKHALEHYWNNNKVAIDYLFFDYLFELAYNTSPIAKKMIDDVPISNVHRDDLQAAMNMALPANTFNEIIKEDTILYKLSWRETYNKNDKNGNESVYSYFLNI